MAASQLPEESVGAHRVLLVAALLPMPSRVFCFKLLDCSTTDRHASKIVGIVAKPAIVQLLLRLDIFVRYKACRLSCSHANLYHIKPLQIA